MFALVQWVVDKTISVVSVDDVIMGSVEESDASLVKYGKTSYMTKIIRVSGEWFVLKLL